MARQTATLKNWCRQGARLIGEVHGHPAFTDGDLVRTSVVQSAPDTIKQGGTVETKNTTYTLQKTSTKHAKEFK